MSKQLRICYFLEEICATEHHEECAKIFENKKIGIRAICNCNCHKEKSSGSESYQTTESYDMGRQSKLDDFELGVNIEYNHRKK